MATAVTEKYRTVIGLEFHVQLLTESKMFCACSAQYAANPPNTVVCPVCLGLPGALPVINEKVIECIVMTGMALNCTIPEYAKFDRKNYPYPDLPKGYQISQYDLPFCIEGHLTLDEEDGGRTIGITRVHQEEDTAKSTHVTAASGERYSLVDFNRSGVPLMEVVTEPDIATPQEAAAFGRKLRQIVRYLGISTGNMEDGAMRCDANISVWPAAAPLGDIKVEVKNMNSFRSVERALFFEQERQTRILESGHDTRVTETRGWVETSGETVSQRTKEEAHDYRYFPEPDLPPLQLSGEWVDGVRGKLPELPGAKKQRFMTEYELSAYDASLLTQSRDLADYFEAASARAKNAKAVANWMSRNLLQRLNQSDSEISDCKIAPDALADMILMIESGEISNRMAQEVFDQMFDTGKSAADIVKEKGLTQISDEDALAEIVAQVIAENPAAVQDLNQGKKRAIGFLVGQVMKATRGKANPGIVNQKLQEMLRQT
ncbi:MAG: Asp-tRNA(Asn)/Glu-tRNA(Gln) amidotransferase subunit GatB [Chloroflexota bacterium]|nr:Asp-tRNA(Asn)/Glu-tRNA(Gln) amidotransferase subunit GatB [Chloroflexota bacterium]MDE2931708.1 Asp-tRNA(Asn)/Glu-tRNA(Gln) amidotransferase subunit GatB [Chloroflexota bacterium]